MDLLQIYLFGPPRINIQGRNIPIQRRKVTALLAYLAVTGRTQSRDTLATLLWPENDQSSARANLRRDLVYLKKAIGEPYLETDGEQVGINLDSVTALDVAQFKSLLAKTQKHGHSQHPEIDTLCYECQDALEQAVAIYQADFMHGFSLPDCRVFDEWQFFESEDLRQKLSEALQNLIRFTGQAQEFGQAISYCRRWLALDLLHEPAHRQLMLLYALDGQQAAALRQYQECDRILEEELGLGPEPETSELFQAIRNRDVGPAISSVNLVTIDTLIGRHAPAKAQPAKRNDNLPQPSTPFVGREMELRATLNKITDPDCRILTLLGPGGSGKTRLAIQIGFDLVKDSENPFVDGVWFVQLAPLTKPAEIPSAIEKTLNVSIPESFNDQHQELLIYLSQQRMLLILDNFEHLHGVESTDQLSEILERAPGVKLIMTSRLSVNLQGEHIFTIAGLETPQIEPGRSWADLESSASKYGAILMFEQCARRVQPDFKINQDNLNSVAQICQRVQGIPLAIELAVAWLELLPVDEIGTEIERSMDFLQAEWHDLPDRQRSLRAVFDSSWGMLSEDAQPAIKALSTFRSSFSRQAAQQVSGASTRVLLELINKSWLQRLADGRYRMHELLRQFAFEQLEQKPITFQQVKDQYCAYYTEASRKLWQMIQGPGQMEALSALSVEFENISTAWRWLISGERTEWAINDILPPLFVYAEIRSKSDPLLELVDTALRSVENAPQNPNVSTLTAILLTGQGAFYQNGFPVRLGYFAMAHIPKEDAIRRAWSIADSLGELYHLGFWGIVLAYLYGRIIDREEGIRSLERVIEYYRQDGRDWELATALLHLSMLLLLIYQYQSEVNKIDHYLNEAQHLFNTVGDGLNVAYTLRMRGISYFQEHELRQSIHYLRIARVRLQGLGEWMVAADISWQIGSMLMQLGETEEAFRSYRETFDTYNEGGLRQRATQVISKASYENVRYGSLSQALEMRQRSLELAEQVGDVDNMAWCTWEMGDLMRVSGELPEARHWYERSFVMFDQLGNRIGMAFYQRGLGDLALATQEYSAAQDHFISGLEYAQGDKIGWVTACTLNGLGRAELGLGEFDLAGKHFVEAVRNAKMTKDKGVTLVTLLGLAAYYAAVDQFGKAVELALLVKNHYASWNETREQASGLLADLAGKLPADQFIALHEEERGGELWDLVDKILSAESLNG